LTLFGDNAGQHALFAAHITAETYVTPFSPQGVPVDEWTLKPSRPDNHWFDATELAFVGANWNKIDLPGAVKAHGSGSSLPPPMSLAGMAQSARAK
jgi:hypothetical protein